MYAFIYAFIFTISLSSLVSSSSPVLSSKFVSCKLSVHLLPSSDAILRRRGGLLGLSS
ncbi:hypothetical protein GIB67_000149, partial [Kingdonia uniflora]